MTNSLDNWNNVLEESKNKSLPEYYKALKENIRKMDRARELLKTVSTRIPLHFPHMQGYYSFFRIA
jgi:hypothetical protein